MRFTPIAAWAILAYGSVADDAQKVLSDESSSSAAESATSSVDASLPTFTVSLTPNPKILQQRKHCRHGACAWSSPRKFPGGGGLGKLETRVQSVYIR
jgi:hypothetical protein